MGERLGVQWLVMSSKFGWLLPKQPGVKKKESKFGWLINVVEKKFPNKVEQS